MITYKALIDYNEDFKNFLEQSEKRYNESGGLKAFINHFDNKIIYLNKNESAIIISEFEIIPPIYLLFVLATLTTFIFSGLTFWLFPPGVLSLTGFFWSADFYKWVFRKGLKKAGYTGRLEFISAARALREVLA